MSNRSGLLFVVAVVLAVGLAASKARADNINVAVNGPIQVNEGSSASYYGSINHPGRYHLAGGSVLLQAFGEASGAAGAFGVPHGPDWFNTPSRTFQFLDNGIAEVRLSGTVWAEYHIIGFTIDRHPQTISTSVGVTVFNVAPTIDSLIVPTIVSAGAAFQYGGTASDPGGIYDPLSYWWDFDGDGVWDSTTKDGQYSFASPGTYTGYFRVADDDFAVTEQSFSIKVGGDTSPVPEPSSLLLLGLAGAVGLFVRRRR